MFVTIDLGQILEIGANAVVLVGGAYGLWRFLKRQWRQPDPPDG